MIFSQKELMLLAVSLLEYQRQKMFEIRDLEDNNDESLRFHQKLYSESLDLYSKLEILINKGKA